MPLLNLPQPRLLRPKTALMHLKLSKGIILQKHPELMQQLPHIVYLLTNYKKTTGNAKFTKMENIANKNQLLVEVCIRIASTYKQYFDELDTLNRAYKEHLICIADLNNHKADAEIVRDYWIEVTMAAYENGLCQTHYPITSIEMQ